MDAPYGVDYYLWLPTRDHFAPRPDKLITGAQFLKHLVDLGHKVYVHCQFGHGRAPSLVAAYLILEGMTPKDAITLIKKKRKVVHPNDRQKRALEKFYKKHSSS